MMGRTHALSGLVTGVAIGLGLLPEPLAFTTGTRPERWVVAPAMMLALVWLVAVVEKVVPADRLPLH